jgi:hypothetical protein
MLRPTSATKPDPTEAWVLVLAPRQTALSFAAHAIPEYYPSSLHLETFRSKSRLDQ